MPNPYRTIRRVGRIVGRVIGWTLYWLVMLFSLFLIVLAAITDPGTVLPLLVGIVATPLLLGLGIWGISEASDWLQRREAAWEDRDA